MICAIALTPDQPFRLLNEAEAINAAVFYFNFYLLVRGSHRRDETVLCIRILDTMQVRRRIAFSSAADVTIQRFNESRQRSEMFF
jgi:hypothetical protein